ncbi:hypothetical protein [Xylella fastidiosa]|uniref:hypothetical protein n=1 Tax=Xylella fastidiosa TaxID=2371 RepID=UPI001F29088A|nr:hypothetical protein [Xylella fastidiosa]
MIGIHIHPHSLTAIAQALNATETQMEQALRSAKIKMAARLRTRSVLRTERCIATPTKDRAPPPTHLSATRPNESVVRPEPRPPPMAEPQSHP